MSNRHPAIPPFTRFSLILTAFILIGGTIGGILLAPNRRASDLSITRAADTWPPKPLVGTDDSTLDPAPPPITP